MVVVVVAVPEAPMAVKDEGGGGGCGISNGG